MMPTITKTIGLISPYIILLILLSSQVQINSAQITRAFPNLFNAAKFKTITTSPSQATCGYPLRTSYCKSFTLQQPNCLTGFCEQDCPQRTALPINHVDLLRATGFGTGTASDCISQDGVVVRPNSPTGSVAARFETSSRTDCFLTPVDSDKIIFGGNGAFTLSVWIKRSLDSTSRQTLFEKGKLPNSVIFSVQIVNSQIFLQYGSNSVQLQETIPLDTWTHLALQVYDKKLSVFKDGGGLAFAASETANLTTQVQDDPLAITRIGQSLNGQGSFTGHLQDFRFYGVTLTNREIIEIATGTFPVVHAQSDCRCPSSHPRVLENKDRYCISNGVPDNTKDEVIRLNENAHPLEYLNDDDGNSIWISTVGNLDTTLEVALGDEFQVFYVTLQFYSPYPRQISIKRWHEGSVSWEPWQYYADDCTAVYGMTSGQQLTNPDSVNCINLESYSTVPYSKGNVTFVLLSAQPVPRPGHNDFYGTPVLYDFVRASRVQITMKGRYYSTQPRDNYYGLYDLIVTARCDCNGHAETCDTSGAQYKCACSADSFTMGNRCEKCQPLYNDKPFHIGDQINAYNCKPCTCNNHATACYYQENFDPSPRDHEQGGGGFCENCQHNTKGRFCDTCINEYYKPTDKLITDVDVCSPCACNVVGTVNKDTECAKDGGQCNCKTHVDGRTCQKCRDGYYNLTESNPVGCDACFCNTDGTVGGAVMCEAMTGDCECKLNVNPGKCTSCKYGFYNLDNRNAVGCTECSCNPKGSTSHICNPGNGHCVCNPNVIGKDCDECADHFYNFEAKCLSCGCNVDGTLPGYPCNKTTGKCVCKRNVGGHKCDVCLPGYYSFAASVDDGCLPCACETRGTINGSESCHAISGQCTCKQSIQSTSRQCDQCLKNSWNISATNPIGCQLCYCDYTGTVSGDFTPSISLECDSNTGQCNCLANRYRRQCDKCVDGYFKNLWAGGGCSACQCKSGTRPGSVCDETYGECVCKDGIMGHQCDECADGFWDFNDVAGTCKPCTCNVQGSSSSTCEKNAGKCVCKSNVEGDMCDQCKLGTSNLDGNNPFGCSGAPAQQGQPTKQTINATTLVISWAPPDEPNGIIRHYILYRDNVNIGKIMASEPRNFTDSGLQPYTFYTYRIEAYNDVGHASSQPIRFQTPPGVPEGTITLRVNNVGERKALFAWNVPAKTNGPISKYVLEYTTPADTNNRQFLWNGTQLTVGLTNLVPFTNYTFYVKACTTGGCLSSAPVDAMTQQGKPESQASPTITALSATSLFIDWKHPAQPNGIIIAYELWMRSKDVKAERVFISFGQYNPRPTTAPQENALPEPETNYTVINLKPYTEYEFQVFSQNEKGKASSVWTIGRTLEASPLSTPPPIIVALSSSILNVTWVHPSPEEGRGAVVQFRVIQVKKTNKTLKPFDPPFYRDEINRTDGSGRSFMLTGLPAYSTQTFLIEACNSIGCVNSTEASGRTEAAPPKNQMPPSVNGFNSSVMLVSWDPPAQINGPSPTYKVEKTATSFNTPPPKVIRGTRFPGGGYHMFPPNTIPQVVGFTGIDLWFKTSQTSGLLVFAASEGRQEEFLAVQLRYGRPWFLFDPQGCMRFMEPDPTQDGNRTYNDNQWHHLVVRRESSNGYITIDEIYQGSKVGSCSSGNIIGSNTGVYIGGLPSDFIIKRTESDYRSKVVRQGFQGCMKDIKIMTQFSPVQVWSDVEWSKAVKIEGSFPNWEGCPVSLLPGAHFLGRGHLHVDKSSFTGGDSFNIEIQLRTETKSGLIFFMFGNIGTFMYAQMIEGALQWTFEMRINNIPVRTSVVFFNAAINLCDGQWKTIKFIKSGRQLTIDVGGTQSSQGSSSSAANIFLDSDLYLGGLNVTYEKIVRAFSENGNLKNNIQSSFAGCFKYVNLNGVPVNFVTKLQSMLNVNLDGCPPVVTSTSTCQAGGFSEIYTGLAGETYDHGLSPFTEYFYRVTASNSKGSAMSDWASGRTREGAPTGVSPPFDVKTHTGFVIEAKWNEPSGNTGFITEYKLRAHNLDKPSQQPAEATFKEPIDLHGNITNAIPYSNYSVKLVACTIGGCTESSTGVRITTQEEAPGQVQPIEVVKSSARWLHVQWALPKFPNGIITGYFLYGDNVQVYSGGQRSANITGLSTYTTYLFHLDACTVVGCTSSATTRLTTDQLPPTFMQPPTLTVYGTKTIYAQWITPSQINGVLERYQLYQSLTSTNRGSLIYDSLDPYTYYTIQNLTAGTTYHIIVAACTGGGCRLSSPANATTEESSPEGVLPPTVTSPDPASLKVVWQVPTLPNGIIIQYNLFQNGLQVYSHPSIRQYEVTGLQPYSRHLFRVQACTSRGCGSSPEIIAFTQEAAPSGDIVFELSVNSSRSVLAKWTNVPIPNGVITYSVYFKGLFYIDPANWNYQTVRDRRPLFSDQFYGVNTYIDGLLPHSTYEVQVNASNSKGWILSDIKVANMPMGSPDGVKPPVLTSPDSTSIQAIWEQVGRFNANEQPAFQLQFRGPNGIVKDIFQRPTTVTSHLEQNLSPYTEYELRLVASNTYGQTVTPWESIYTKQDTPGTIDPPMTRNVQSRQMDVIWTPPLFPNGIITQYKIYANNAFRESVPGNVTIHTVQGLTPYTTYVFAIEVCTIVGCKRSQSSSPETTLPAEPEGIPKPVLLSETPTSVLIQWGVPTSPNGILTGYSLQRRKKGEDTVVTVKGFSVNEQRRYVDEADVLKPYMVYEYRITASTAYGIGYGPWGEITTKSSRPSPMSPPIVRTLSPTSVVVEWKQPDSPNGRLERYIIRMPEPRIEIRNTSVNSKQVDDLIPYTQYSVTVTACTDGGCTESTATIITTGPAPPTGINPPTTTPVSRTVIQVNWERPLRPNGPNLEYELSRKKIRQPLDAAASGFGFWQNVYSGTGTFFEDRGLTMFTTYVYRVTAINDEGFLLSDSSAEVSTFGGVPRKPAVVTAQAVSHVAIRVSWVTPSVIDLQGRVETYRVLANTGSKTMTHEFGGNVSSTVLTGLTPNTLYEVKVVMVINGGESITSQPVYTTTMDGAPEGLNPPQLFVVSNTELRVVWTAPSQPNGAIIAFYIYVDGNKIDPGRVTAGSYTLRNLQPYTVYAVQMEVCTQFACLKSNITRGTTAESAPDQMSRPNLNVLGPYSIDVTWTQPASPNGIIMRYDLIRETIRNCADVVKPTVNPDAEKCTYVECNALQGFCGSLCYSGPKTCCDGVLHDNKPGYACCGDQYIQSRPGFDDACCNGKFYARKDNHECCGGRYVQVLPDEICCPDANEDRADIGVGNQCCGSVPYSSTGSQMCCNNKLHDRFNRQCCGNEMIAITKTCCGDSQTGVSYFTDSGRICCGTNYVSSSISTCCESDTGKTKIHTYSSAAEKANSNQVCCGIELVSSGLSCCNTVSYNPVTQVCADKSYRAGTGCGNGRTCAIGQASMAECDRCDFDTANTVCFSYTGLPTGSTVAPPTNPQTRCTSGPVKIFSGLVLNYKDENLEPWTRYEYAVVAVNKAGSKMSDYAAINTSQALPQNMEQPVAKTLDNRQDLIQLQWKPPLNPNGEILRYVLYRSNLEIYRGFRLTYTDTNNIKPYQTYAYKVQACNIEGCVESKEVLVATLETLPESVDPPSVSAINATALQLNWNPPSQPNGIIVKYIVYSQAATLAQFPSTIRTFVYSGLSPYTEYTFILSACTGAGCKNSSHVTGTTLQSPPIGLSAPNAIIISSTVAEIYWLAPTSPNGLITGYTLYRDGVPIHQGPSTTLMFIDNGLTPGQQYTYKVEVFNSAGSTMSGEMTSIMPTLTPEGIPAPVLLALSPTSVNVTWYPPLTTNGVIDQYKVLKDGGTRDEKIYPGLIKSPFTVDSLSPYTVYNFRIQACIQGQPNGCGTGPGRNVVTLEAPPIGMEAPVLTALGATVVRIEWKPPTHPNGLILRYQLYRRNVGSNSEFLINFFGNDTFFYVTAGTGMTPFTEYEYKVIVENSVGKDTSDWSRVRTLEDIPSNMNPPTVTSESAYALRVTWQLPSSPNGVITMFKVEYQQILNDPTLIAPINSVTVHGNVLSTSFSGLLPFTSYNVRVAAHNSVGKATSSFTQGKTGEAAPADIKPFTVEKRTNGQSVVLRWDAPGKPNGVITSYKVYDEQGAKLWEGISKQFEFLRLVPYTEYSALLEACTTTDCGRTSLQKFTTSEIAPKNQPSPTFGNSNATHIVIKWVPPINAYGKIILYEVFRKDIGSVSKRAVVDGALIYGTSDTDATQYSYTDGGLEPYFKYEYKVRAHNSITYVDSDWVERQTDQASPGGMAPPTVEYFGGKPDTLRITWSPPLVSNGVIQSYQLQRNQSQPISFSITDNREYIDTGLRAYTVYSYIIRVCTAGGCTPSAPTLKRTQETAPLYVNPPQVNAVNSTAIQAIWTKPQTTNGKVTQYQLKMDGTVRYSGLALSFIVIGLTPYKEYRFVLSACTNGGCTDSNSVVTRPTEAKPKGLQPPTLRVVSANTIEITWKEPDSPNGVIIGYELRRDNILLYEGVNINYIDYGLQPGVLYSYQVTAENSRGNVLSGVSTARTFADSPKGLIPPVLQAISSSSIKAAWSEPTIPNGVIRNYTLLMNDAVVCTAISDMECVVDGLAHYTEYNFRVKACTDKGCGTSVMTTERTLSAPPMGMSKPTLTAQANSVGAHAGILAEWTLPSQPNGAITGYKLERRKVIESPGSTVPVTSNLDMIYNGTETDYRDSDLQKLQPFSKYQYRVIAVNIKGQATSAWQEITTLQAPPEQMLPPTVEPSASTLKVTMTAPVVPNGYINQYKIYLNGSLVKENSQSLVQTVGDNVALQAFTWYAVQVEACTAGGCTRSAETQVKTLEDIPSGLAPLTVSKITATTAELQWTNPSHLNGIIKRFEVTMRTACPFTEQPASAQIACTEGGTPIKIYTGLEMQYIVDKLLPYTNYEFQLSVHNNVGNVNQPGWTLMATLATAPEYLLPPKLSKNGTLVVVTWSQTFRLNGKLAEYILYSNGKKAYSGFDTKASIERASKDLVYTFYVIVQTSQGTARSPDIVFDPSGTANGASTTPKSGTAAAQVFPFYQEVWFIVLVTVIALLILFTGIAFCLRSTGLKAPYIRERMPLPARPRKDGSPLYCIDPYDGSVITTDIARAPSHASLRQVQTGFINPAYSHSSLPRSLPRSRASSVIDLSEKMSKSSKYLDEEDDAVWDSYMPEQDQFEDDNISQRSGRPYSVLKEHTMFTDTHL